MCTYTMTEFGCGCVKEAGELVRCAWGEACGRDCADFQQNEGEAQSVFVNCIECNGH